MGKIRKIEDLRFTLSTGMIKTLMNQKTLRIISRESPLAMWQAHYVRDQLQIIEPGLDIEIIGITTQADRFLQQSLSSMGGKGAFVKELEQALIDKQADIAVHSMKDVPIELPDGLAISAILRRENVSDALVSTRYQKLEDMPNGVKIGTSSLRRCSQLKQYRPDFDIKEIRGNVGTRMKKLEQGEFDALILASAGLIRLGLDQHIAEMISHEIILPAVGQGALGIETRVDDELVCDLLAKIEHRDTRICVEAERAVSGTLNGGCHAPIAAYADINQEEIYLQAMVGQVDGKIILKKSVNGMKEDALQLGQQLAEQLIALGADKILEEVLDK
jgi:hydroxymethylbilane synthase